VLPDAIGSVGRVGGVVGIAIGLVFAWSTWSEWHRTDQPVDDREAVVRSGALA
jgi:hypothetical protein